jgi:hypothetical protein
MALPSGAPAMRDHRSLVAGLLVSALSLQSSGEEGRDGALRWGGRARAELHAGSDVGFWATAEVVGGGDERKSASRSGEGDCGPGACVLGGGYAERLAVRTSEAARGRGCGGDGARAEGAEGRSTGRLGSSKRAAYGIDRDSGVQSSGASGGPAECGASLRVCRHRQTWCVRRIASRRCFFRGA